MLDTTLTLSNIDRFKTNQALPTAKAIPLFHKEAPKSGVRTNNTLLRMCDAQQTIKIGM